MIKVNVIAKCKRCHQKYVWYETIFESQMDPEFKPIINNMREHPNIYHRCGGDSSYGIAEIIGYDITPYNIFKGRRED